MDNKHQLTNTLLYNGSEGAVTINVIIDQENETLWATQKTMSELFQKDINTIGEHLQNIFKSGELDESSVTRKFRVPASDGKNYDTKFYNLDAMISVGYRVNSKEATQFRKWATSILKEYMIKGFVLDDELLKNGTRFGKDYFDELLERVKEIRTSERRYYQKITDVYATSYDYKADAEISREFFANVQNKLHYAVTEHTASELLLERVNIDKPNMGLTTWKNSPKGKITKKDVTVAKNVLTEKEISELNNISTMLLDYAENQARRHNPMSMIDWISKVDNFLEFNEYPILRDKGNVKREDADREVLKVFEDFRIVQDRNYKSDYDEFVEKTKNLKK